VAIRLVPNRTLRNGSLKEVGLKEWFGLSSQQSWALRGAQWYRDRLSSCRHLPPTHELSSRQKDKQRQAETRETKRQQNLSREKQRDGKQRQAERRKAERQAEAGRERSLDNYMT
jgi:hypothetical protein